MKKLTILLSILSFSALATPTINVFDLGYAPGIEKIGLNNFSVVGSLLKTGKYKVIDVGSQPPTSLVGITAINESSGLSALALQSESNSSVAKLPAESQPVNNNPSYSNNNTDYSLIGEVTSISETENTYLATPTTSTVTSTLSVIVSYRLIDNKNSEIVASFNSDATANQTMFYPANGKLPNINKSQLLKGVSALIADDVVAKITNQTEGHLLNQSENTKPVITDVKTYE